MRPPLIVMAAACDTLPPQEASGAIQAVVRLQHHRNSLLPAFLPLIRGDISNDKSAFFVDAYLYVLCYRVILCFWWYFSL